MFESLTIFSTYKSWGIKFVIINFLHLNRSFLLQFTIKCFLCAHFLRKGTEQCDLIWRFLGYKFNYKSCPNIWKLLGEFFKHNLLSKNCSGYFLGNFLTIWATLHWPQLQIISSVIQICIILLQQQQQYWSIFFDCFVDNWNNKKCISSHFKLTRSFYCKVLRFFIASLESLTHWWPTDCKERWFSVILEEKIHCYVARWKNLLLRCQMRLARMTQPQLLNQFTWR